MGTLFIVATPIGNLNDISQRAINTLKEVDLILAEDTRHSQKLLTALNIKNKLSSYHAHNESIKSESIIEKLQAGTSIALISDAGTPLISDPGFILVRQARQQGITVVPIPGACALITAISASGIPCDAFTFIGFLPAKANARRKQLENLTNEPRTLIFYESTHRILESLEDIALIFAERPMVLAKELTKSFENFCQGKASQLLTWLKEDKARLQGEFVLIIEGDTAPKESQDLDKVLSLLLQELPVKKAAQIASKILDIPKNKAYQHALTITNR